MVTIWNPTKEKVFEFVNGAGLLLVAGGSAQVTAKQAKKLLEICPQLTEMQPGNYSEEDLATVENDLSVEQLRVLCLLLMKGTRAKVKDVLILNPVEEQAPEKIDRRRKVQ